ncbi:MAG TPA: dTDP-4-dehydrorhamnose reductase [Acidimicrobiales bacterium]|nr:dTDP-4-dehydrorhamnose reductase [Acidimicrobiales bacterium]
MSQPTKPTRTRVLVTGATGQLGGELLEYAEMASISGDLDSMDNKASGVLGISSHQCDLSDREQVLQLIGRYEPEVIIHSAAWTDVDGCELDPDRAFRMNALATRNIAESAGYARAHICYLSTDYVFNGEKNSPYNEWDTPEPINVYGKSKLAGEMELPPGSTIVRTSWLSSRRGRNIVKTVIDLAADPSRTLEFVDDQYGSPTFAKGLANLVWKLAIQRRPGIFNITNQGTVNWYCFAKAILEEADLDPSRVHPISTAAMNPARPARRPKFSVLDNCAIRLSGESLLPSWRDGLKELVAQLKSEKLSSMNSHLLK